MGVYQVSVEFSFSYAHRLVGHPGKCRHLHGHNGRAVVTVCSSTLDSRGMVLDFAEVRSELGPWIEHSLDHAAILDQADPLVGILPAEEIMVTITDGPPTAECLARMIFDRAQQGGLAVVSVEVWESATCGACYREEGTGTDVG